MKNKIIIYLIGFLFTIPLALTSYINSSLLEEYINKNYIGLVYSFASIITIIGILEMPKLLTRIGNRKASLLFSIITFISLTILSFGKNIFLILPGFIIYFIFTNFLIATLDIFIEETSSVHNIGKTRGLYLSIINTGWVLSQIISGSIIEKSSFLGIYLFSALFMILVIFILSNNLYNFIDPRYKKVFIKKTISIFLKNKNLLRIYLINLILKFFYSWMIIYTTLYLHENIGFNWAQIGTIYTFMLLPFVLLSYPLGKISDKIGEKKFLIYGFLFSIISTFFIPFINVKIIYIFALILFTTRIGAAIVEVMSESYFFKLINRNDVDEIAFFRTTSPISFIIGPSLATISLIFIPDFSYLFYILTAILLIGLILSLRLKDVK